MSNDTHEAMTSASDLAAAQRLREIHKKIRDELRKIIVGQDEVVEGILICLVAGGHALLEGVPGLGKTTLLRTL